MIIDEEDVLIHTLNGLPHEFNAFKTSIRTRAQPITIEELHTLLKAEELTLDSFPKSNLDMQFRSAMHASEQSPSFRSNSPNYRGGHSNMYRGRVQGYNNF